MSLRSKLVSVLSVAFLLPVVALAQQFNSSYFTQMANGASQIIATLIPAFMGLGFIAFFWFLFQYVKSVGDDKAKNKNNLLWSVVAIVLMISIYGLAGLVRNIFGATDNSGSINAPTINGLR